ncbi:MAG: molybdopterin cofactor-binding domain-containing protein [Bryobacteraceae bacterium]|nr:molybdopterin cofactor-binding domain-containing protein [Bryobacteraceae bacterium]
MADELRHRYRDETEAERGEPAFTLDRRELFGVLGAGVLFTYRGSAQDAVSTRLHFADDGSVTLLTGKNEMGQGPRTILTQAVAEELRVPPSRVKVVMADTAQVPDDGGTWASITTPLTVPVVRKAAAAARKLRLGAATDDLTPAKEWKVLGTSLPPVGGRDVVTGARRYSTDLKRDAMLHGAVVRPPAHRAKLESVEPAEGVIRDGNFVGVVAPSAVAARKAARQVQAKWTSEPLLPSAALPDHFRKTAQVPDPNPNVRYPALFQHGDVAQALAAAPHKHEASYTLEPIAHVPLEPRAAVAEWKDGKLTVWSGAQAPFLVRRQLAQAFSIDEANVRVVGVDIGGAFGGKQNGECEIEAARLAKAAGRPVKLQWSREEEFTAAYARPAGVIDVRTGTDSAGKITAWEFRNYNSGPSGLRCHYDIPHMICAHHRAQSPLRQGSYRSLAAAANTFAREAHIDELAAIHETDPLEFRLKNLADARTKEVLQRAAERFGWGKAKHAGVACNLEKDARLALFAEMEGPKVRRVVVAFDPGAILNPDGLRHQIMGATIQGIGGALFERLTWDSSNYTNARLSKYRVPRFSDAPEIDIILIDRREIEPAGAGEAPITIVAPALAAALFAQDGKRRRNLPLLP